MSEHTCTIHRPGDRCCYNGCGCRCGACRDGATRYDLRRRVDAANGRPRRVDAAQLRSHLDALMDSGLTNAHIATAAGIATTTVTRIIQGRYPQTRADVAARILAVQPLPPEAVHAGMVDACGTRLRIRALAAIGWDHAALAREMGTDTRSVWKWCATAHTVAAETRARVVEVYDLLWDKPQDSYGARRAIARAGRRGWLPPMALDDDQLDDPGYRPRLVLEGRTTIDRITDATELGMDIEEAVKRLGIQRDSIRASCQRAGSLNLWDTLVRRSAA